MEFNAFQNKKLLKKLLKNEEWNLFKFSDVFLDNTKLAKKIKKEDYLKIGKYPIIDQGKKYIAGYTNYTEAIYDEEGIIFGDHTRIIKYVNFPLFLGADGTKLLGVKLKKDCINIKYLYYFLKTIELPSDGYSRHFKYLKEIIIAIPSIKIQNKIVEVLDMSYKLIENRKKQIKELDLLVKSKFIEMFGDPFNDEKGYGIKKLGEVTEVNPKKSEIKELDKDLIVSFVPMDRVSEKGEFAPELSKPISEVYNGFTYFKDNDVLFAKITPCMENGKGAIAINLSNGIGFGSTEFHVLRPIKDNSNPYWIYHLTTLIEFRRLAERKMTGSAGQKRVPTDFLNNVEVVIPPIELQNQFADFAKQVDKLKFEMEKSLKELEDNFNSLMQKAFNGELFN
ncbi:restriction endonuclease subunit S [Clostridium perfringens]